MLHLDASAVMRLISNNSRMYDPNTLPREPRRVTTERVTSTTIRTIPDPSGKLVRAGVGAFRILPTMERKADWQAVWVPVLDGPPRANEGDALLGLLEKLYQDRDERWRSPAAQSALRERAAEASDDEAETPERRDRRNREDGAGITSSEGSYTDAPATTSADGNRPASPSCDSSNHQSKDQAATSAPIEDDTAVLGQSSALASTGQLQLTDGSVLPHVANEAHPLAATSPGTDTQRAPPAPTRSTSPQASIASVDDEKELQHDAQDVSSSENRQDEDAGRPLLRLYSQDSSELSDEPSGLAPPSDNDSEPAAEARGSRDIADLDEADAAGGNTTKAQAKASVAEAGTDVEDGDAEKEDKAEVEGPRRGSRKKNKAKKPYDDHANMKQKRKKDEDHDSDKDEPPTNKKPRTGTINYVGIDIPRTTRSGPTAATGEKRSAKGNTTRGRRRTIYEMHDDCYYLAHHGDLDGGYVTLVKGANKRQIAHDWRIIRSRQVVG